MLPRTPQAKAAREARLRNSQAGKGCTAGCATVALVMLANLVIFVVAVWIVVTIVKVVLGL